MFEDYYLDRLVQATDLFSFFSRTNVVTCLELEAFHNPTTHFTIDRVQASVVAINHVRVQL